MFILNVFMCLKDIVDSISMLVYALIEKLQPFFEKNIVFFMDTQKRYTELIDAYSLFEKAVEKGIDSYYLMSSEHPSYKDIKEKYRNRVIEFSDYINFKHFFKFLHLKKFINSFGFSGDLSNFLYKNKYIDFVYLNHGVTLLKDSIFEIYNSKVFNKFLVSNDVEAQMFIEKGGFKEEELVKATMPHFDLLKDNNDTQRSIFVFFTWRMSFDNMNYKDSLYYKNLKSLIENTVLHEILKNNNVKLNIALHHCLRERNINFNFENVNVVDSTQISECIRTSAMLITDYSSIWADFYFQNKPVIFYRIDNDDKNLDERDIHNMEFANKSNDILTNIVYNEENTIDLIKKYINSDFKIDETERQIQDKFFYVKENVREKILESEGLL